MADVVHLPNGQVLSVSPVFAGYFFKPSELNVHSTAFPAGWTIILQTEDYSSEHKQGKKKENEDPNQEAGQHHSHIHPFRKPTLSHDHFFISSISNPSSSDFKAPASPTRQIAMMLWASLYWYFHLIPPSPYLSTESSKHTPESGKPRGEWRINIKREGVFRGRNLIQKLERMGLISCGDASVGPDPENAAEHWSDIFVARRMYWQISPHTVLFSPSPIHMPGFPGTPFSSRPTSPNPSAERNRSPHRRGLSEQSLGLWSPSSSNPYQSGSHLPTYYPPPSLQYTTTSGIRHPLRPKAPRQGETFYTRYIPSVGQYLSFRTASIAPVPASGLSSMSSPPITPSLQMTEFKDQSQLTDIQLLSKWMNNPRVSAAWGEQGPTSHQENFLKTMLTNEHSFPAIGMWDGKPFGYFELYWAKEDTLGKLLGDRIGDFDRGIHALVGEEEFRGKHRVMCWLSSLVHWAFLHDNRTMNVVLEPRIDNERYL